MPVMTLYEVVTVTLEYRKLCASWFLKMLMETQKEMDGFALNFFTYETEFINNIVTGDYTPESKQ